MNVTIENAGEVIAHVKELKEGTKGALRMGLNDSIRKHKTLIKRTMFKTYAVQHDRYQDPFIKFASNDNLEASLTYRGKQLPIAKFKIKPNKRPGVKGAPGGKGAIKKAGGLKDLTAHGFKAFVATMSNGHYGMFRRYKSKQKNIKEIMALSVPTMVQGPDGTTGVYPSIKDELLNHLKVRSQHHLDRLFS